MIKKLSIVNKTAMFSRTFDEFVEKHGLFDLQPKDEAYYLFEDVGFAEAYWEALRDNRFKPLVTGKRELFKQFMLSKDEDLETLEQLKITAKIVDDAVAKERAGYDMTPNLPGTDPRGRPPKKV